MYAYGRGHRSGAGSGGGGGILNRTIGTVNLSDNNGRGTSTGKRDVRGGGLRGVQTCRYD